MLARCKVRVPEETGKSDGEGWTLRPGWWAEVGSRVDGKFAPVIFRGVVGQKGTQCRGQDRFSSLERRGSRTGGPGYVVTLHEKRRVDRATLLPKRCSPLGLGKQRATGLPRDVINHFLLRKARRERERKTRRERGRGRQTEKMEKGDSRTALWEVLEDWHSESMAWHRDSWFEPIDLKSLINCRKNIASIKFQCNVLELYLTKFNYNLAISIQYSLTYYIYNYKYTWIYLIRGYKLSWISYLNTWLLYYYIQV